MGNYAQFCALPLIWTQKMIRCLFLIWYILEYGETELFKRVFLVEQRIVLVYFTSIQINPRNERRCVVILYSNRND